MIFFIRLGQRTTVQIAQCIILCAMTPHSSSFPSSKAPNDWSQAAKWARLLITTNCLLSNTSITNTELIVLSCSIWKSKSGHGQGYECSSCCQSFFKFHFNCRLLKNHVSLFVFPSEGRLIEFPFCFVLPQKSVDFDRAVS